MECQPVVDFDRIVLIENMTRNIYIRSQAPSYLISTIVRIDASVQASNVHVLDGDTKVEKFS